MKLRDNSKAMAMGQQRQGRQVTQQNIWSTTAHRCLVTITIIFSGFMGWMIYMANTAQETVLFALAHSIPHGDKVSHVLLFGLLTLLLNLATRYKTLTLKQHPIYAGSLLVLVLTTLEELSQYMLPNRTLDMADYAANLVGVSLFTLITVLTQNYLCKRPKP